MGLVKMEKGTKQEQDNGSPPKTGLKPLPKSLVSHPIHYAAGKTLQLKPLIYSRPPQSSAPVQRMGSADYVTNFTKARSTATGAYTNAANAAAAKAAAATNAATAAADHAQQANTFGTAARQANALQVNTPMNQFATDLGGLPGIPQAQAPRAGNHIFNALGSSCINFYHLAEAFLAKVDRERHQPTGYKFAGEHDLLSQCREFDSLRDEGNLADGKKYLRYYGTINSNNDLTYGLYSSKYFYDCLQTMEQRYGGRSVRAPDLFDVNQVIDQPAATARRQQLQVNRTELAAFEDAYATCRAAANKLIHTLMWFISEAIAWSQQ